MSQPTTGIINEVFQNNMEVILGGFGAIQSTSGNLLIGLATIELLLFLWGSYLSRPEEFIKKLFEKIFLIFVIMVITFNWGMVAGMMKGYIAGGGASAGGGSSMITSMNPAYVASDGLDKVAVIFSPEGQKALIEGSFFNDPEDAERKRQRARERKERQKEQSYFAQATGIDQESMIEGFMDAGSDMARVVVVGLIFCLLAILIVFTHFYVALQLFVLTIDWYLTVAITQLLVPFAINKHTSPLATAAFQAVVRKSVQLGVMVAVLGMFGNTVQALGLGPQPTMVDVLSLLLGSLTLAFMVKNVPQIAGSIFSGGGSSVDIGGALQAAAAMAAGGAASIVSGGASAAAQAGVGAAKVGMGAGKLGVQAGVGAAKLGVKAAPHVADAASGLASRAGAFLKSEDQGLGGRDSAPASMAELHQAKMADSAQVSNQVEQNRQGSLAIDGSGNVQGAALPEPSPREDQAYRSGLDARQGVPALGSALPAVEQMPKTQQMSLADQAQNYASTQEMSALEQEREYGATQSMAASASPGSPTQQMSASEQAQQYAGTQRMEAADENYAATQAMEGVEANYAKTQAMGLPEKAQQYARTQKQDAIDQGDNAEDHDS